MQTITAIERISTRLRPSPQLCERPTAEVITTHAGVCPTCSRAVRIGLGREALVYGGCGHLTGIEQRGAEVSISFEAAPA
jgi:hypothetical protein